MRDAPIERRLVSCLCAMACLAAVACSGGSDGINTKTVTLQFAAKVGNQPFACGGTYSSIGATNSTIQPIEFQMYVSQVELIRANGDHVPFAVREDGKWQGQNVAMLDFSDGKGLCAGSPDTNAEIVGDIPDYPDYKGIRFTVGVPPALDHLNAPAAKAPLNVQGMWWSWTSGYKFLKVEVASTKNATWFVHIGSSDCGGNPDSYTCKWTNQPRVTVLDGFTPGKSTIVADIAALYAGSDLDHQANFTTEPISGCMCEDGNDLCLPVFANLGMKMNDNAVLDTQSFFRLE